MVTDGAFCRQAITDMIVQFEVVFKGQSVASSRSGTVSSSSSPVASTPTNEGFQSTLRRGVDRLHQRLEREKQEQQQQNLSESPLSASTLGSMGSDSLLSSGTGVGAASLNSVLSDDSDELDGLLPVSDLVESLLDGDIVGVERYLSRLSEETRVVFSSLAARYFLETLKELEGRKRRTQSEPQAERVERMRATDLSQELERLSRNSRSASVSTQNSAGSTESGGLPAIHQTSVSAATSSNSSTEDMSDIPLGGGLSMSKLALYASVYAKIVSNADAVRQFLDTLPSESARGAAAQKIDETYASFLSDSHNGL
jgi:hypothetical protein